MRAELSDAAFIDRLQQALDKMPARRRNIYLYVRVEDHSYAEAAEVFGTSIGHIRNEVRRAMKALRRATRPQDFRWWQRLWRF